MEKKSLAIVGIVGLPAKYGGFETLVENFTRGNSNYSNITVYCENTKSKERLKEYNNCRLRYLPFKANGIQSIIYDSIAIILSWFKYDSILILGTPGSIVLPFLRFFKKTHTVINFGGLEWQRDKWNLLARLYLKFSERVAVKHATIVVADNQHFCNYIKSNYNTYSSLIEYGGDHAIKMKITDGAINKYKFLKLKYDISISRAQPDNNLHLVLDAYSKVPSRNIVLISNYNKFSYGRQLKEEYRSSNNIYLLDAIYDINVLNTLRSNAELYIHSHTYCGTAPSLVEAMNLELPVVSYKTETNLYTTEESALYFSNVEELIDILRKIQDSKLTEVRRKMYEIALRRYNWPRISSLYNKLLIKESGS